MKKSYLFPNFVLPLFGALAVMCAGSCSQEILEVSEDLAPDNPQTRAGIAKIGIVILREEELAMSIMERI